MRPLVILFISIGITVLACGCDNGEMGPGGGTGGDGTQAQAEGGVGPGFDAFVPKECSPACTPPKLCSKIGVCIDPGTCAHDQDCESGMVCDPQTQKCIPENQCGAKEIKADVVPPNLLINLDRSCSMKKAPGTGMKSKWEIAVAALSKLLTANQGKIRFGLTMFPDTTGNNCTQDAIPVPVGAGNETKIKNLLTAALVKSDPNYPDGPCVTNIDTAMEQAAAEPSFADKTRESFVLLITDGKQAGCNVAGGDKGTTQIITDLYKNKSVATFVVGFGGAVDPAQLNIFADAGGTPTGDPTTHFYKAEDQATLDTALAKIAKTAMGCVYKLGQVPANLNQIFVFFDNQEVQQDPTHQDGWDWDKAANKVTFYGPACDKLKDGKVKDLDIVYGCKNPVPDPDVSVDAGFGG